MTMGQNLYHIWVDEHPFTIYFDVHYIFESHLNAPCPVRAEVSDLVKHEALVLENLGWFQWGLPQNGWLIHVYLGGGFNPPEKYQSVGMIIPNIRENQKMFQTTNQLCNGHVLWDG